MVRRALWSQRLWWLPCCSREAARGLLRLQPAAGRVMAASFSLQTGCEWFFCRVSKLKLNGGSRSASCMSIVRPCAMGRWWAEARRYTQYKSKVNSFGNVKTFSLALDRNRVACARVAHKGFYGIPPPRGTRDSTGRLDWVNGEEERLDESWPIARWRFP